MEPFFGFISGPILMMMALVVMVMVIIVVPLLKIIMLSIESLLTLSP